MNLNKYPYAKKFLMDHPEMTIDSALLFVERQLKENKLNENKRTI